MWLKKETCQRHNSSLGPEKMSMEYILKVTLERTLRTKDIIVCDHAKITPGINPHTDGESFPKTKGRNIEG